MKEKSQLLKGIPVLASLDINATISFYKEKLGFDRIGYADDSYAIIARHNLILHFWKCNDKIHPENTSCYVEVENIDHLYKEFLQQNVIHPNGKLEYKPHGMREFAILDSDGNMIKFGQEI